MVAFPFRGTPFLWLQFRIIQFVSLISAALDVITSSAFRSGARLPRARLRWPYSVRVRASVEKYINLWSSLAIKGENFRFVGDCSFGFETIKLQETETFKSRSSKCGSPRK